MEDRNIKFSFILVFVIALSFVIYLTYFNEYSLTGQVVDEPRSAGSCPASMLGSGIISDPCQITNCTELQAISQSLDANYALVNNIDCSDTINWNGGQGFIPIGIASPSISFSGNFDGRNKTITNLYINRSSLDGVGLFGAISFAVEPSNISNFGLINASVSGNYQVGAVAGFCNCRIKQVYATGNVFGSSNTNGGLVGYASYAMINDSYAHVNVNSSSFWAGGLVGYLTGNSFITNSYSTGNISATSKSGGLIGESAGSNIYINNSFSIGRLYNTTTAISFGGLIGVVSAPAYIGNSHYMNYSVDPKNCVASSNPAGCFAHDDQAYFKGDVYPNNLPFSNWNFFGIWQERFNDFPSLTWQNLGGDLGSCPAGMFGEGIYASPCIITSCQQLQNVSYSLSSHYILANNLNCSGFDFGDGKGFMPIGNESNPFVGDFNGNNKSIFNVYINRTSRNFTGIFGYASGKIYNLRATGLIKGFYYTGGIAGQSDISIVNSSFIGNVSCNNTCGGIAGINNGTINMSFAGGFIIGGEHLGGLCAKSFGNIANCYSFANVNSSENEAGGLVGDNKETANITNSYAIGNVSANAWSGGLSGDLGHSLTNSFSTGKVYGYYITPVAFSGEFISGLVARNGDILINSYWYDWAEDDASSCTQDWNHNLVNTNCTMKNSSNGGLVYFKGDVYPSRDPFSTWDFWNVWVERSSDYPKLAWEGYGNSFVGCGDNYVDNFSEQCDDGNNENLDGCNSTCGLENLTSFYNCSSFKAVSYFSFDKNSSLLKDNLGNNDGINYTINPESINTSIVYNGAKFNNSGNLSFNKSLILSDNLTFTMWVNGSNKSRLFFTKYINSSGQENNFTVYLEDISIDPFYPDVLESFGTRICINDSSFSSSLICTPAYSIYGPGGGGSYMDPEYLYGGCKHYTSASLHGLLASYAPQVGNNSWHFISIQRERNYTSNHYSYKFRIDCMKTNITQDSAQIGTSANPFPYTLRTMENPRGVNAVIGYGSANYSIDEFIIYNNSLSEAQLDNIYNRTKTGNYSCNIYPPACGDGIISISETCDDFNNVSSDGCSSTCTIEVPSDDSGSSSGGSSAGGAGGASNEEVKLISSEDLFRGYRYSYVRGEKINFTIDGQMHEFKTKLIMPTSVLFSLQSTPKEFTLNTTQTLYFDLNENGKYNLSVTLNNIRDGKADVTLKLVSNAFEEEEVKGEVTADNASLESTSVQQEKPLAKDYSSLVWIIVIACVLILFLIILFRVVKNISAKSVNSKKSKDRSSKR